MTTRFKRSNAGPALSREEAERQGRISTLAFLTLGQADAIAFLNGFDDALGGRPIDLAIKSAAGFTAVEQAISARG